MTKTNNTVPSSQQNVESQGAKTIKRVTKIIGIDIYTFDELPEAVKELFRLTANVRNNAQADNFRYHGEFCRTTIGEALPMPFLPQYLGTNYAKQ